MNRGEFWKAMQQFLKRQILGQKQPDFLAVYPRAPSRRFVSSVSTDSPRESIFSENSAFTRLPVTPKKKQPVAREFDEEEKEEQSGLPEALAHLSDTVTELAGALESVQRQKDARAEELQRAA